MTKYACDLCKSDLPEKMLPLKIRIGSNMHDFCNKCHTTLLQMLEGTGAGVIEPNMAELMGKLGKTNQGIYPNEPVNVPNNGFGISWKDGNYGLNVDSIGGLVGTTVTYTAGTNPSTSMSNAGPYLESAVQTSGFITQANNNVSLAAPEDKGIFSVFTQDAIYDSLKDMMSVSNIGKRPSPSAVLFPMKGV